MSATPDPSWHNRYQLLSTWPNTLSFLPPSFFRRIINIVPPILTRLEELIALHESSELGNELPVDVPRPVPAVVPRPVVADNEVKEECVQNDPPVSLLCNIS